MEMANLLDFNCHEKWVERLLSARLDTVPSTHVQPTFSQLQQADRKLFQVLAEKTRSGVQITSAGRPLDAVFEGAWQSPEVLHLLQPMPKAVGGTPQGVPPPPEGAAERPPKIRRTGSKGGKGPGRGKSGQGKGSWRVPSALVGTRSHTNAGEPICFGFGLRTCRNTVSKGRCEKGLHICGWPRCGKSHPALDCPLAKSQQNETSS